MFLPFQTLTTHQQVIYSLIVYTPTLPEALRSSRKRVQVSLRFQTLTTRTCKSAFMCSSCARGPNQTVCHWCHYT